MKKILLNIVLILISILILTSCYGPNGQPLDVNGNPVVPASSVPIQVAVTNVNTINLTTTKIGVLTGNGTAVNVAISGLDFKTVDGNSILGPGNIPIGGFGNNFTSTNISGSGSIHVTQNQNNAVIYQDAITSQNVTTALGYIPGTGNGTGTSNVTLPIDIADVNGLSGNLSAKEPTITPSGVASQFWNGLKSFVTIQLSDLSAALTNLTVNGQPLSGNITITNIMGNAGTATVATTANSTLIPYLPTANVTTGSNSTYTGLVPVMDSNGKLDNNVSRTIYAKTIAETTTLTVANGLAYWTVTPEFTGYKIATVFAAVYTWSTSGTPTFGIYNLTQAVNMLSTNITILTTSYNSSNATIPAVADTTKSLITGDQIRLDCTVAGTGTMGMDIVMVVRKP